MARAARAERLPGQPPLRAFLLGLLAGIVYFVGTIYWTSTVVATFGQLPTPLAVFAMLLLAAYLALYPALAALVTSRADRAGRGRGAVLAPAAWVATEFLRGIPVRRLPVGAARQQPGHRAARGAAGERARRLRPVGARRVRERRDRYALLTAGRARVDGASRRSAVVLVAVGGVGHLAVADGRSPGGHADARRAGAGQHRAGRQVAVRRRRGASSRPTSP